jgi:serine O-acetyltransferase
MSPRRQNPDRLAAEILIEFKQDMEAWFAAHERDPASGVLFWCNTALQFLLVSGVMAVGMHRVSRALWVRNMVHTSHLMDRLTELFTGAQLPGESEIGPRFRIDNPKGVVIGQVARIGTNVCLNSDVVLGTKSSVWRSEAPVIGNDVTVMPGVKLLGAVTVGDRVTIEANSVVLKDIPSDCVAAGAPAKPIDRDAFIALGSEQAPAAP